MKQQSELFGKTFDQQLIATDGKIEDIDISPNRRIKGEVIFEPTSTGVRVTARDEEHRLLWGYVASKDTLRQIHNLVATYETLQQLVAEELESKGKGKSDSADPIDDAKQALDALESTVQGLRGSLTVKKVTDATRERARQISRIISDANRLIALESGTLKGMKSKTEQSNGGDA